MPEKNTSIKQARMGLTIVGLITLIYQPTYADDARAIMQRVIDRNDGDSQYSLEMVATCEYALNNQRISCTEKPRIKVIETTRKDYGVKGRDKKSIMIIQKPAAESGIGFLQYDYDDPERETDQWMYLSALGKVKRIISGNENEPKKGSLFGSEFSYEDIEQRHIDDFTYKITEEETYQGRPCWVIESHPTPKHARKSNYSRSVMWVDKERDLILKSMLYDRGGKLIKQLTFSDYVQKDGIWVSQKINMNNIQSRRISTIKTDKLSLNIQVEDELFNQRTLTDGAFREKRLHVIRQAAE